MKLTWLERKIRVEVPEADVELAVSRREASWEADIIIPAVPYAEQAGVASRIKDVVTGKVIISLGNPMNETHNTLIDAFSASAAEELARHLPYSKIVTLVSANDAIRADEWNVQGGQADVVVAGEDKRSVETVLQLVADAGFHPVVAGRLSPTRPPGEVVAGGEEHATHS
jgi:hypothetical protein